LEAVPGKHSVDSLHKTAVLGTSHTVRNVLQSETGSLSSGDHRWINRSTGQKRPVTRDNNYDDDDDDDNNNNNNNNNNPKIIIIIIIVSFMQGIHTHTPETNHVPRGYIVAAILSLLFMVPLSP